MGNRVRYDGQHKGNATLLNRLVRLVSPLTVCPEAMAGLGIPRPPLHLVTSGGDLQAVGRDDPTRNETLRLQQMALIQHRAHPLLAGALLQSRSPSCGVGSTPHFDRQGLLVGTGSGLFAGTLLNARPWLPTLEDTAFECSREVNAFLIKTYLCADWLYLQENTRQVWRWALDFFCHHEGVIAQLTRRDAEAMQTLFVSNMPPTKKEQIQQTVSLFLLERAAMQQ